MFNKNKLSRRGFIKNSALAASGGAAFAYETSGDTGLHANLNPSDFPDLRIKEVKVHITNQRHLARVITESGIEGNYTMLPRYFHPNWNNAGWTEYAKSVLIGKSALDREKITSQFHPFRRRRGQSSYAAAIDICLWDILGKAAGLPIYKLLGAAKEKCLAYTGP